MFFLFYDIGEDRINKIFKICKKYLEHYQNSVFCGEITPSNLLKLEDELKKIAIDDDKITILKFINKNVINETILIGNKPNNKFL